MAQKPPTTPLPKSPSAASVRPFTLEQYAVMVELAEKLGMKISGLQRYAMAELAREQGKVWPGLSS